MPLSQVDVATSKIRNSIIGGRYSIGDRLPTLDELSREWFSATAGPQHARAVYAPLIADGLVEARTGRNGGHFVVANRPMDATATNDLLAEAARSAHSALEALTAFTLYVVEFQKVSSGSYFGASLQPSRGAAEQFAIEILTALGESPDDAAGAASAAGWGAADSSTEYAVRIFPRPLRGKSIA